MASNILRAWRCNICGEITFAVERPTNCAFCGSAGSNMYEVPGFDSASDPRNDDPNRITGETVSRTDIENLLSSIEMERADVERYELMSERATKDGLGIMLSQRYKRLAKLEAEHLEIFEKLVSGRATVSPRASTRASMLDVPFAELARRSSEFEFAAGMKYAEYARSSGGRLAVVWSALSEVENGHIGMTSSS